MTEQLPPPLSIVCHTADCPENGLPKQADAFAEEFAAGEILCGACGEPITATT